MPRLGFNRSERETLARLVGVSFLAYGAYYLIWRAGWSLNLGALWLALPLLAAELLGFVDFVLFLVMTWRVPPTRYTPAPDGLSVDVYITTYNESPSLLRSTILGALHMRYPHETYVLDDGRRPEVAALASALGARYIARDSNVHAKAGNINHAMTLTQGEFIAVFDADQVPHPQFLERTLGRFDDPRVALVQTPQEFYNVDSIQHAGEHDAASESRWHEQALFYRVIQPGKERLNSVFWCGSNAVLRRAALESIGGIATETITEDIHTTIKLHKAGWRTAYHDEVLAAGIAPDDFDAFVTQRKRWAQGAMQVLRSRDNPLWARGLTVPQRMSYWASMSTYFSSFQKLVLIATPLAVLVTGVLPMRALGWDFVAHFAPYFALGLLANSLLGRGYGRYLDTERFNLLKSFAFVRASASLIIPRRLKFQVTRKTRLDDRTAEVRLTAPYMLIVVASVGAFAWALQTLLDGSTDGSTRLALALTAVWATYNAGVIGLAARAVLTRSHRRGTYRFDRRLPLAVKRSNSAWRNTSTADMNPEGLGFYSPTVMSLGEHVVVRVTLPGGVTCSATAVVMNARSIEQEGRGEYRIGVRFVELSDEDRNALTLFLFNHAPGASTAGDSLRAAA